MPTETHYSFPELPDSPTLDFLRENNLNPADIPAGSEFYLTSDEGGDILVVQEFQRENGRRVIDTDSPDPDGVYHYKKTVERRYLVAHPSAFGFMPIPDGPLGGAGVAV